MIQLLTCMENEGPLGEPETGTARANLGEPASWFSEAGDGQTDGPPRNGSGEHGADFMTSRGRNKDKTDMLTDF